MNGWLPTPRFSLCAVVIACLDSWNFCEPRIVCITNSSLGHKAEVQEQPGDMTKGIQQNPNQDFHSSFFEGIHSNKHSHDMYFLMIIYYKLKLDQIHKRFVPIV